MESLQWKLGRGGGFVVHKKENPETLICNCSGSKIWILCYLSKNGHQRLDTDCVKVPVPDTFWSCFENLLIKAVCKDTSAPVGPPLFINLPEVGPCT